MAAINLSYYPTTFSLGRCSNKNHNRKPPACQAIIGSTNLRWKDGPNERAIDRRQLRKAFGNYWINGINIPALNNTNIAQLSNKKLSLTPFRRAMNAGDPFNTVNMLPDSRVPRNTPSNQVQGSRRATNQAAASTAGNGLKTTIGGSAYTGNPKRVYDSSDYIRYKKLLAKNNNYNDPTFGGDDNFASQVLRSRVHISIRGT